MLQLNYFSHTHTLTHMHTHTIHNGISLDRGGWRRNFCKHPHTLSGCLSHGEQLTGRSQVTDSGESLGLLTSSHVSSGFTCDPNRLIALKLLSTVERFGHPLLLCFIPDLPPRTDIGLYSRFIKKTFFLRLKEPEV